MKINNPNYLNGLTVSAEQINAAVEGGGTGLTPEQIAVLGEIEGLEASASEIDNTINMILDSETTLTKSGDTSNYLSSSLSLDVVGRTKFERTETEMGFNRPVSWSMRNSISPSATPSQTTDFHGLDIYGTVSSSSNSLDLSNTSNYLFESKASYAGSGILGGNIGGFIEANNYGPGTINENKALRIYSRNFGTGHVKNLYGIALDSVVNNGTIENAYGIKIGTVSGATKNNYAIWSDGGKVRFAGDISNTGAISNTGDMTLSGVMNFTYKSDDSYKIKQKVGSNEWYGEITPFSSEGGMVFNVTYAGNGAKIDFKIDSVSKMIIKENGNIGIGTTSPSQKLEVVGKIKATSINFSGLPTSTTGLKTGDVWNDSGTLKII